MSTPRVVHYLNQFFAGIGAEAEADTPPGRKEGAAGPAVALQQALGDRARVVATVYCGDNYAVEREQALDEILALIAREQPDIVVAGPAFAAGRYGLTCGEVCARAQAQLGVTAVSGMHPNNPGADLYRTKVYLARTRESALGMGEAIQTLARLALKLHAKEKLGSPQADGYLPTGQRVPYFTERTAAERAVDMLLRKTHGQEFTTEWAVPEYHRVDPAPPIRNLAGAKVALVSSGGVVPRGNPDRLEAAYATKWLKYPIADLDTLTPEQWQSVHGGFDTTIINQDPNRMVPLDALRTLEKEGAFAKLHDEMYTTVGNTAAIPTMRRFAQEMIKELQEAEVEGVLLTSA
jgi:glycine reductase complex component B subunit gamma